MIGLTGFIAAAGTKFPQDYAERALNYYHELSNDQRTGFSFTAICITRTFFLLRVSHFLSSIRKASIGHLGYDIGVFLNNHANWLDWDTRLEGKLDKAIADFADAFRLKEDTVRKWAFCQMVLSWWWMFDEMPSMFGDELGLSDIWKV